MAESTRANGTGAAGRHPEAVAMLVCERIIRDERTGRITLVDLLGDITARTFPFSIPSICVYARLTDAEGAYEFAIDVVRRADVATVARLSVGRFEALDPLEDGEIFVHH